MIVRTLICLSMLSIFNSSQSMDIVKKIKKLNLTKNDNYKNKYKNLSISTELFFKTHQLLNLLPKDTISLIQTYSLLLKNKDLETNFPFVEKWDDFSIPRNYYSLLTIKQITVLQEMLNSPVFKGYGQKGTPLPAMHFRLKSMKEYDQFITLPIQLRECLTLLPISELKLQLPDSPYSPVPINPNKVIQVRKLAIVEMTSASDEFLYYYSKPIIPENSKKKK